MHFVIDWNMVISIGILGVMGFVARQLWVMRIDLTELNGTIRNIVNWQTQHEKLDEQRFDEIQRQVALLQREE